MLGSSPAGVATFSHLHCLTVACARHRALARWLVYYTGQDYRVFRSYRARCLKIRYIDVRKIIGTGIKLLLVCLLIGWVLSVIVIDALGIIRFLSRSLRHAGELATDGVRWAVSYILLGAVIVVPLYIVKQGWIC